MRTYGVETSSSVLDEAFFGSKDYKNIESYSNEVEAMFSDESYIQKGAKELKTLNFTTALDFLLSEAKKGQGFQRYKGLGEMNPGQLWETTLDPDSRTLLKVQYQDEWAADELFGKLMGSNVEPRRNFIQKFALEAENIDI